MRQQTGPDGVEGMHGDGDGVADRQRARARVKPRRVVSAGREKTRLWRQGSSRRREWPLLQALSH